MSGVIKSNNTNSRKIVHAFVTGKNTPRIKFAKPDPKDAKIESLILDVKNLSSENESLKQEVEYTKNKMLMDIEGAYEKGKQDSLSDYARQEDKLRNILRQELEKGLAALDDKLTQLDVLALAIAQKSLEKILGPHPEYREQICAMIRTQIANIRQNMIVTIFVSADDFTQTDALASLSENINHGIDFIEIDRELAAGHCRMNLRVGQAEFSIPDSWCELQRVFESLTSQSTSQ